MVAGVGVAYALVGLFQRVGNAAGRVASELAASAYVSFIGDDNSSTIITKHPN